MWEKIQLKKYQMHKHLTFWHVVSFYRVGFSPPHTFDFNTLQFMRISFFQRFVSVSKNAGMVHKLVFHKRLWKKPGYLRILHHTWELVLPPSPLIILFLLIKDMSIVFVFLASQAFCCLLSSTVCQPDGNMECYELYSLLIYLQSIFQFNRFTVWVKNANYFLKTTVMSQDH